MTKFLIMGVALNFFNKNVKNDKNIVCGVDISDNFIKECKRLKKKLNLKNFLPSAISPARYHLKIILLIKYYYFM